MDDLKNLKKKIHTSFFEDGLFNLMVGFLVFALGISAIAVNLWPSSWLYLIPSVIQAPAIIIGFLVYINGKKYVTTPRIGFVKFKKMRKDKKRILMFIFCGCMLSYLILKFLNFEGIIAAICYSSILGAFLFSVSYYVGFKRNYIFSVLISICIFLNELSYDLIINGFIGPISFVILGIFFISLGIIMFHRFMKKYPLEKSVDIK